MSLQRLIDAINHRGIVMGLTHGLYRYPARFSPMFARAAIKAFTHPGDTILDPFAGGATSLVEALALGRNAVGFDISQLAVFLARVKTSPLSKQEIHLVVRWAGRVAPKLSPRQKVQPHRQWKEAGYQENLPWRFRKVAEQALTSAEHLPERVERAARCIVLKTLQWALDCKEQLPTAEDFRERVLQNAADVTEGFKELNQHISLFKKKPAMVEIFQGSADTVSAVSSHLLRERQPKLVITSPPYPGVHVLYHRWQVQGRKETPAPFWIANCQDGQGASFYTFGDRRNKKHEELYFGKLLVAFRDIRKVVTDDAFVVQLVGFSRPNEQLPGYLQTMREAGFEEYELNGHRSTEFWRSVPNRKWYTGLRAETQQSSEVLLVHRPS